MSRSRPCFPALSVYGVQINESPVVETGRRSRTVLIAYASNLYARPGMEYYAVISMIGAKDFSGLLVYGSVYGRGRFGVRCVGLLANL